jgi:hypothetical protein
MQGFAKKVTIEATGSSTSAHERNGTEKKGGIGLKTKGNCRLHQDIRKKRGLQKSSFIAGSWVLTNRVSDKDILEISRHHSGG